MLTANNYNGAAITCAESKLKSFMGNLINRNIKNKLPKQSEVSMLIA